MIFTFVAVKFIVIFLLFCSRIIYTALFEKKKIIRSYIMLCKSLLIGIA